MKGFVILPDSPAELAATAATFSAVAAGAAVVVAVLGYRVQQPRVKVFLRMKDGVADADLVVEVSNSGRIAGTVLRVGFCHGSRLLRRERLIGQVWTYDGPTDDGNVQRYRLSEHDSTSWSVSRSALHSALDGAEPENLRAFVQLGDGRIVRSRPYAVQQGQRDR